MKRIFLCVLAFIMAMSLVSCGSEKGKNEEQESSSVIEYYYNDDFYYSYETEHYTFRLPNFWKSKFISKVSKDSEEFYQTSSFEEDGSGLLFTIYEYSDKSYEELENYEYLLYDEYYKLHYIMVIPEEPEYVLENEEEYNDLKTALSIVKATFKAVIEG